MGGLVAEEMYFGESGSGVAGDLQAATEAAAQMVGSFGMMGSLFSVEAVAAPGSNLVANISASDDGRAAVESILQQARTDVRELLAVSTQLLEALGDALLERDELVGTEILEVIAGLMA
jgi:ATP-dependent Zn protease